MPKVWTLAQRGISRPGPGPLAVQMGKAEQAGERRRRDRHVAAEDGRPGQVGSGVWRAVGRS